MSAVDIYIKKINELLQDCDDISLLELVYKLLLAEAS